MQVKFIHTTTEGEKIIAYCARVSSPNQDNPEYEKLLGYLIRNKHWSPFEMSTLCVEITTSRAIAQQILRHRSFHYQEFSQRYAETQAFETYPARRQDLKNRQNSLDDMTEEDKEWFKKAQDTVQEECSRLYNKALKKGVAKEQARFLLPLSTQTKLYMHGTIRDWSTYLLVRLGPETQLEHREIAREIWKILQKEYPIISKTLINTYPETFK